MFYTATWLAPLITQVGVNVGLLEPGGVYSLFNTGEHIGTVMLMLLSFFFN